MRDEGELVYNARLILPRLALILASMAWFGSALAQSDAESICYDEYSVSYPPMQHSSPGSVYWKTWESLAAHAVLLLGEHPGLFRYCDDVGPGHGEEGWSSPFLIVYVDFPMRGYDYDKDGGSVQVFLVVEKLFQQEGGRITSRERLYHSGISASNMNLWLPAGTRVPVDAAVRDFDDHAAEIAKLFIELHVRQLLEVYRREE